MVVVRPVRGFQNDLALYRQRANLNQRQAAKALEMPRTWLSLWESGTAVPNWEQAQKLAQFYGTTVSALYLQAVANLILETTG